MNWKKKSRYDMAWSLNGSKPIYLQLVEEIRRRVITGDYLPGSHVPSVRDLAGEAAVNPNTMQRALTELEREGLLENQRTNGRTVTEDAEMIAQQKRNMAETEIRECLERMQKLGISAEEMISMIQKIEQNEQKTDEQ